MPSTDLDFSHARPLTPADLLELYLEPTTREPLLLAAAEVAAEAEAPGPELRWAFEEQRGAVLAAVHGGQVADASSLAQSWLEAALSQPSGECQSLELIAAAEALSIALEARASFSDAAKALAIALRLHRRRCHLPFHGTLLRRASTVLGNLGAMDAGNYLAAEALRLAIESNHPGGIAHSLAASARLFSHRRDWPAALRSGAAAKSYLPPGEVLLRFSLLNGETSELAAIGRLEEAAVTLEQAKAALVGHEAPLTESYLCWTEGRLRLAQGRQEEAAEVLGRAAQLARGSQDPHNRMLILIDHAEALEALGRKEEARERCATLLAELPPLPELESSQVVGKAFEDLCRRHDLLATAA